jgi:hypothetical protein
MLNVKSPPPKHTHTKAHACIHTLFSSYSMYLNSLQTSKLDEGHVSNKKLFTFFVPNYLHHNLVKVNDRQNKAGHGNYVVEVQPDIMFADVMYWDQNTPVLQVTHIILVGKIDCIQVAFMCSNLLYHLALCIYLPL